MKSDFFRRTPLTGQEKSNVTGKARGSGPDIGIMLIFISLLLALLVSVGLLLLAPDAAAREFSRGRKQPADGENGARGPARTWYFAEGATDGGYRTWIQLDNPGDEVAGAELTFHTDGGVVGPVSVKVGPSSRMSINAGDHVRTLNVATIVESDFPITASRKMYGADGRWVRSSGGVNEAGRTWQFEGGAAVGSIRETWILLHNPGDVGTEVQVVFQGDREVVATGVHLDAAARVSLRVGDTVTGYDVATSVESEHPIVAAMTTYGQSCNGDPAARVVQVAFAQVGKPYNSGASGPDSFDCSGLTRYCYSMGAGMDIPHSSHSQARIGDTVGEAELQPGDIVGFHGWGHVGIYVGNGEYVHAPRTGEPVRLEPLSERTDFCGAIRP